MKPKLAVIIPALNEEKLIGSVLSKLTKVLDELKIDSKIIVIDDGSTDKTAQIAREAGVMVISHGKNKGNAQAFRTGVKKAVNLKSNLFVTMDADGQHHPEELPKLIKPVLKHKADLVLGSRFMENKQEKGSGDKLATGFISFVTLKNLSDATTGFRAFNLKVAKLPNSSKTSYCEEQLIRAVKKKFKVLEVPITKIKSKRKSRLIKNRPLHGVKSVRDILKSIFK